MKKVAKYFWIVFLLAKASMTMLWFCSPQLGGDFHRVTSHTLPAFDSTGHEDTFQFPHRGGISYRFPHRLSQHGGGSLPHKQTRNNRILVGVLSTAHLRSARDSIRQTWAYHQQDVYFLIAGKWSLEVENEFREHEDVIWVDSEESYRGITLKVVIFLAVLHKHVDKSYYEYFMKTDDDSYVQLTLLQKEIAQSANKAPLYWGAPCSKGPVIRNPNHKWYVAKDSYRAEKYPQYASGAGYLIHSSLVSCLYRSMQMVPELLPNEDAYMGILVNQCNATCTRDERFPSDQQQYKLPDHAGRSWFVKHHVKTFQDMVKLHAATLELM